jgi:flagellar hook-length control protein FliK
MNPSLPNNPMASLLMSLGGNIDFQDLKLSGDGASGLSDFSNLLDQMQLQPLESLEKSGISPALAAMPEGQSLPLDLPLGLPLDSATDGALAIPEGQLSLVAVEKPLDGSGRELMGDTLMAQIQKGKDISVRYTDQDGATDNEHTDNADPDAALVDSDASVDTVVEVAVPLASASVSPAAAAVRSQNAAESRLHTDQRTSGKPQSSVPLTDGIDAVADDAEAELVSDVFKPVTAEDSRVETSGFRDNLTAMQNHATAQPLSATATPAQAQSANAVNIAAASDLISAESTGEEIASEDYTFEEGFEQKLQRQFRERLDFGQDRREWTPALGARLMTMVANDVQHARIQLDPPELGSLEIRMQVQNDQASVQVSAQSHQVKDVLDSSAQRLRDALAAEGIELNDFSVSADSGGQGGDNGSDGSDGGDNGYASGSGVEGDEIVGGNEVHVPAPDSLLDTFA